MFNERSLKRIFTSFAVLFFMLAAGKLFYLQIIKHGFYERLVETQSNARVVFTRDRGVIFDRNGRILAKNKKTASLYTFGKNIEDPVKLVKDLQAAGVYIKPDLQKSIENRSSFIWIHRHMDIEKAQSVKEAVPGVDYSLEDSRFYPEGGMFAGIIGYTGVDNQGLAGVEYFADRILEGKPVPVSTVRDSRGRLILFDDGAINTKPDSAVYLTLDVQLQALVDEVLKKDLERFQAKTAIALAVDVKTGDIILSSAIIRKKGKPVAAEDKNFATMYLFEPGSIFKAVTFGYLIENNMFTPAKYVDTSKPVEISGHKIKDVYPYSRLTQQEVFIKSSNIGTVLLTGRVKNEELYNYLIKAGFGNKVGVRGASEESGILRKPDKWSRLSLPSLSIGQEIMTTPIQVVRYYSAIANGGIAVNPTFIKGVTENDRYIPYKNDGERVMSEATAKTLLGMMEEVVATGTGKQARSKIIGIGGKTGTAQLVDYVTGEYSKVDYIASFAGTFPLDEPRVAMIVIYESPKTSIYGGATGAATFKRIAEQIAFYYNIGNDLTRVGYAGR